MNNNKIFSGTIFIKEGEKILLNKGYGYSDKEFGIKNISETKFMIGSITKFFTAILIMKMVEDRLITLDDKLNKFIPNFPDGGLITVRELLTHTSGLPRDGDYTYYVKRIKYDFFQNNVYQRILKENILDLIKSSYIYSNKDNYYYLKNNVQNRDIYYFMYLFNCLGLDTEPPTLSISDTVLKLVNSQLQNENMKKRRKKINNTFIYSNYGYMILGYIIEKVTKKKYIDYLKEKVLIPLNMASTGEGYTPSKTPLISNGAYYDGVIVDGLTFRLTEKVNYYIWPGSAGMLYSNTQDLMKLIENLNLILKPESIDMIFKDYIKTNNNDNFYGFGIYISYRKIDGEDKKVYWHDGRIYNYRCLFSIFPEKNLKIIILTNEMSNNSFYNWPYKIFEMYDR